MTLTRLRAAAMGPGIVGRTVLLLAVVGAVLVGLLAMHTIAPAMSGHQGPSMSFGMQSSPMQTHGLGSGSHLGDPATADCSGTCDPNHVMSGSTCVLALLFTGVVLFALASRRWPSTRAALLPFAIAAGHVERPPRPPDLTELSISRT